MNESTQSWIYVSQSDRTRYYGPAVTMAILHHGSDRCEHIHHISIELNKQLAAERWKHGAEGKDR